MKERSANLAPTQPSHLTNKAQRNRLVKAETAIIEYNQSVNLPSHSHGDFPLAQTAFVNIQHLASPSGHGAKSKNGTLREKPNVACILGAGHTQAGRKQIADAMRQIADMLDGNEERPAPNNVTLLGTEAEARQYQAERTARHTRMSRGRTTAQVEQEIINSDGSQSQSFNIPLPPLPPLEGPGI